MFSLSFVQPKKHVFAAVLGLIVCKNSSKPLIMSYSVASYWMESAGQNCYLRVKCTPYQVDSHATVGAHITGEPSK